MKNTRMPSALWALLFGNLIIGSGVLVVFGVLNDLSAYLQVSAPKAGQIISAGAITICLAAPILATVIGSIDRRKLLTFCMVWYAALLALTAIMPSFNTIVAMRILTVLAPAIFTAQSAVCAGALVPVEQRGKAITLVMLGWGLAMVIGIPLSAWISGHVGWQEAFYLIAFFSLVSALWLWRKLPAGMKPPALNKANWLAVWRHPSLKSAMIVTVLYSSGQFVLFAYMAPVMRDQVGLNVNQFSGVLIWLGLWGVAGSLYSSQVIGRLGSSRVVNICMVMIATTLLLWPLVDSLWLSAVLMVPWGMAFIAVHSAQQSTMVAMAPDLASASMSLSTSGMYIGQGLGAVIGGIILAGGHMIWLGTAGMLITLSGLFLNVWVARGQTQ